MPDNEKTQDRRSMQVTTESQQDVEYWTYKLNCSENELRDAVESVGNSVDRVTEYLHILKGDKQGSPGT